MRKIIAILCLAAAIPAGAQKIEKAIAFDKYTLADTFKYQKTERHFQWDKVRAALRKVEQMQTQKAAWGVLQNKNNSHGEAPLVKTWHRDEYNRVADKNNLQRYQSIPLYSPADPSAPELYGRDGSPVRIVSTDSLRRMMVVETVNFPGQWIVPVKYVKRLPDNPSFTHVVIVDRTMQTAMALERSGDRWLVRSMNPATTGAHKPPYQQPTPLGIHVVQEKKQKMLYTHDGSSEIAGFAPWASRFSGGGYVHGVPVNSIHGQMVEFSNSLGTTPRSHMCVRNATSHAKYIYDWAPVLESLVVVIE